MKAMSWKIFKVFTKVYKEETEYMEFMSKHINFLKLTDDAENIDIKIDRLVNQMTIEPMQ